MSLFLLVPMVSAVWWNPFTWFQDDGVEVTKGGSWVEIFNDNPDLYSVIPDKSKHDADIYLCSKTATKKADLKDLDFATSFNAEQKDMNTKAKLKPIEYEGKQCYYYKPAKDEKFLKFGEHSTHFIYTEESITAEEDGEVLGKLSLTTENYEYKNGKPNIQIYNGENILTHTFYLENYNSDAITNLRTIDLKTNQEVERNAVLKYLSYEEVVVDDYEADCSLPKYDLVNCQNVLVGNHIEQKEVWNDMASAVDGNNYIVGIFSTVLEDDYIDADFDFYGISVLESPIDWASWQESLNANLFSYYKLDETSVSAENVKDELGNLNLSNTDVTVNSSGIINTGYFFNANGDKLTKTGFAFGDTSISGSMWINVTSANTEDTLIDWRDVTPNTDLNFRFTSTSNIGFQAWDGVPEGTGVDYSANFNKWTHVAFAINGTICKMWVNGISVINQSVNFNMFDSDVDNFAMGNDYATPSRAINGYMDEVAVWNNRMITQTDVTNLYGGGNPPGYLEDDGSNAPSVVLIAPADTTNYTMSNTVNFQYNCTDDVELLNCSLFVNGASVYTNTSKFNGTYSYSSGFADGNYTWYVQAYDNESQVNTSATRTFSVLYQTGINATLLSPTNALQTDQISQTFTAVATDNIAIENVTFFLNGVANQTNSSGVNGTYYFPRTLSDGLYSWYIEVFDSDENSLNSSTYTLNVNTTPYINYITPPTLVNYANISQEYVPIAVNVSTEYFNNITYSLRNVNGTNYTQFYENETYSINFTDMPNGHYHYDVTVCTTRDKCNVTDERHINHDNDAPVVTITSPTALENFIYNGKIFNLNWTVVDVGAANLSTCWYNYNSINTSVNCSLNTTTFSYVPGVNDITLYANDTFGNEGSDSVSISAKITENSRTQNNVTYQTKSETYSVNVSANSSLTAVDLVLNNTAYAMTNAGLGIWSHTIDVPATSFGNASLFYNYTYAGSKIQSEITSYQYINQTLFGLCSSTLTNDYINISFKDETVLSFINASIPASTFIYYLGSGSETKTYLLTNNTANNYYLFCATPNQTFYVDPFVQYESVGYPQRIWNPDLTSFTETVTNYILYLLDDGTGVYQDIQIINSADQPVSGAQVILSRYFGEDLIVVSTITTADSGVASAWLNSNFLYYASVSKEGYDTVNTSFFPTSLGITINIGGSVVEEVPDYSTGIYVSIEPENKSLLNNTAYDFILQFSSSYWDVEEFGFVLKNSTGSVLGSDSVLTNSGTALVNLNTGNNSNIIMYYYYVINGTYINKTSPIWYVSDTLYSEFSIKYFFTDLSLYLSSGLYGIDDFGVSIFLFLLIFISTGIMSYKFGLTSPAAVSTLVFTIILFLDVGVGLLDNINPVGAIPHFLTVFTGIVMAGLVFREVYA